MSILIDTSTRLVVQGITGRDGAFHTQQMLDYGTSGRRRRDAGQGRRDACTACRCSTASPRRWRRPEANTSVIYVPAPFAADAVFEAADAGLGLIVCITEGMPVRDTLGAYHHVARLRERNGRQGRPRLVGPNCPGLHRAGLVEGRHPARAHLQARPGRRRVAQRHADLRGRPPAHARRARAVDVPRHRRRSGDRHQLHRRARRCSRPIRRPRAIVLIGEIGGSDEEDARAVHQAPHPTSRSSRSSPGRPRRPASAWGTRARSSPAAAARRPRRWRRSRPPAIPVARIPSEIPALIAESLQRRALARAERRAASARERRAQAQRRRARGARPRCGRRGRASQGRATSRSRARAA